MADRPVRWRRMLLLTALAPLAFGLQALAACFPADTEALYARGLYPWIQASLGTLASWSPIALGESLLLLGVAVLLWRLTRGGLALLAGRRRLRNLLAHAVAQAGATFGVLFLLFQLLWAVNHARLPFATQVGLQPRPPNRRPCRASRWCSRTAPPPCAPPASTAGNRWSPPTGVNASPTPTTPPARTCRCSPDLARRSAAPGSRG